MSRTHMLGIKTRLSNVKYSIIVLTYIFKAIHKDAILKTGSAYLVGNNNICFLIKREEIGDYGEYAI